MDKLHNMSATERIVYSTITVTRTVTNAVSVVSKSVLSMPTTTACPPSAKVVQSSSSAGLGVFTAFVVVMLVVVTAGWVWTYWTMKKREGVKINVLSLEQVRAFTTACCLRMSKNPAYEGQSLGQSANLKLHSNPSYEGSTVAASELPKQADPSYEIIAYRSGDFDTSAMMAHDYELPDEEKPITAEGGKSTTQDGSAEHPSKQAAT